MSCNAFNLVLQHLPGLPQVVDVAEVGRTFSFSDWHAAIKGAPRGSGAGGDGLRPDHIASLVAHNEEFDKRMFEFHSYVAHGTDGTNSDRFQQSHEHDVWIRVLLLLPRWLWHQTPSEKITANVVRGRAARFLAWEWQDLHADCMAATAATDASRVSKTRHRWEKILSNRVTGAAMGPAAAALDEERCQEIARAADFIITVCGDLSKGARKLGEV